MRPEHIIKLPGNGQKLQHIHIRYRREEVVQTFAAFYELINELDFDEFDSMDFGSPLVRYMLEIIESLTQTLPAIGYDLMRDYVRQSGSYETKVSKLENPMLAERMVNWPYYAYKHAGAEVKVAPYRENEMSDILNGWDEEIE